MIKIFRKNRKKTLKNNTLGKYFAYVFGEIFLVIIGILIALGINKQSENKKKLELRDLYVIQLNDEADRNIEQLIAYKNTSIEMLKEIDTLFQLLVKKEYKNPKLSEKFFVLIGSNQFFPIMITYENLKFSGDIKLFEDLNLRNSISETYETFNPIKRFEILDHQAIAAFYQNFLMPNVSFKNMSKSLENEAKHVYFENMVLSRLLTIKQNQVAYGKSIKSLKNLKRTLVEID